MLLAAAALTALTAFGASEPASKARPTPLDLSWAATPACSSREELQAEVARLLRAAEGEERPVLAHAALTPGESGAIAVDLRLEIAGAVHRRTFEAESCPAAKSAIALILAIAINPAAAKVEDAEAPAAADADGNARAAAASPVSPTPAALTPPRPPATSSSSAPRRAPRAPLRLWLGLSGVADLGTLPRLSPGGELALTCQLGHARLDAAASFLGAQHATEATSEAGGTFAAVSGHLRFAYGGELGKLWLGPFASLGLTRLSAAGSHGTLGTVATHKLVPELGAGGLLGWQAVSLLGFRLSAEAVVPTFRPRFVVVEPEPAPKQPVSQSSKVAGRLMIGATLQFL